MDSKIVRICKAGDQLPLNISILLLSLKICWLTLQYIQTDTAKLIDVGVIYFCEKSNLGWSHGIVVWEEQFKLEDTPYNTGQDPEVLPRARNSTLIGRLGGPVDHYVEIPQIVFVRNGAYARNPGHLH